MSNLPATTIRSLPVFQPVVVALTPREREVVAFLADRWTDQEIADELCISYRTVTTHVSHIFDKLGITSRRAVRSMVRRSGDSVPAYGREDLASRQAR